MRGPGFSYARNMDGSAYVPSLIYVIGKNSVTFTMGDAVRINTSGFVDIATAGEGVCGFVSQVVDTDGGSISPDSGTLHDYTMNSANQTSTSYQYRIGFIPALPNYLFYNDADEDLSESDIGMYFNAISESQIDGGSNHDTTQQTFRLWVYDPDSDADASKGLFSVVESQFGQDSWDREA